MKSSAWNMAFAGLLASGMCAVSTFAEDGMKALPTLLIKGEVVSVDVSDPAASLLKVKDRYGFETPIFLTQETKVTQADAASRSLAWVCCRRWREALRSSRARETKATARAASTARTPTTRTRARPLGARILP